MVLAVMLVSLCSKIWPLSSAVLRTNKSFRKFSRFLS